MIRQLIIAIIIVLSINSIGHTQDTQTQKQYDKHGVVWSVGLFKSWLKDNHVEFNKIEDHVMPVFLEENKSGFAIQSHYMYKPHKWLGIGAHIGLGLDVSSYIEAPVLLFGGSVSLGDDHQFIIDFGIADAKRRIIRDDVRNELLNTTLTEIPDLFNHTQFNTGYYIGFSYKIF